MVEENNILETFSVGVNEDTDKIIQGIYYPDQTISSSQMSMPEDIDPFFNMDYSLEKMGGPYLEALFSSSYESPSHGTSSSVSTLSYSSVSSSDPFFDSQPIFNSDFTINSNGKNDKIMSKRSGNHSLKFETGSFDALDDEMNGTFIEEEDPLFHANNNSADNKNNVIKDPKLKEKSLLPYDDSDPSAVHHISKSNPEVAEQYKLSEYNYSGVESDSEKFEYEQVKRQRRFSRKMSNSSSPASATTNKKVSDARLSAQGLAEVLKLDSAEEALKRERFILDIFEKELHYPLGYKTWVRDTNKEYRTQILKQLHERVKTKYPEYDQNVLETIIRRATYYMMQSRLRRERRAKAKAKRDQFKKRVSNSTVAATNSRRKNPSIIGQNYDLKTFVTGTSFMM